MRKIAPGADEHVAGPHVASFEGDLGPAHHLVGGTVVGVEQVERVEVRDVGIGAIDLVEVAPIYDTSGMTSLVAANMLYEMLCVLPGVGYRD